MAVSENTAEKLNKYDDSIYKYNIKKTQSDTKILHISTKSTLRTTIYHRHG